MKLIESSVLDARVAHDEDDDGTTPTVIALRGMYGWVPYRITDGGWEVMPDEEAEDAMRQMGISDTDDEDAARH